MKLPGRRKSVVLRRCAIFLLHRSGYYLRKLSEGSRRRALVLVYHKVGDGSRGAPDGTWRAGFERGIARDRFESHMRFLRDVMHPIPLTELAERVRQGEHPPPGSIAVTFDDGYRDNFTRAHPILMKHRIPATIFVATAFIESKEVFWWDRVYDLFRRTKEHDLDLARVPPLAARVRDLAHTRLSLSTPRRRILSAEAVIGMMESSSPDSLENALAALRNALRVTESEPTSFDPTLTWGQIEEMSRRGISIESHTHTHPFLSSLSPERVEEELHTSRAILEQRTGRKVYGLAYPGGRAGMYTDTTMSGARRAGYRYACVAEPGDVGSDSDPFAIRRVPVGDEPISALAHRLLSAYRLT